jgi:hypothetical protein
VSETEPCALESVRLTQRIFLEPFFTDLLPVGSVAVKRTTDIGRDHSATSGAEDLIDGLRGERMVAGRLSAELAPSQDVGAKWSCAHECFLLSSR